ncbi:hypothetical protein SAMN04490247_0668 [Salimicrobium halophilum]|uniref:DUF4328 domain-containing protein n=1 Tax=Salimicrobium halophilum TaxID=86666 RepID=A0A1G8QW72_9BACI|nr:hypothetical protein SAMN04490247_0668 [Salimicrobium halophilum]
MKTFLCIGLGLTLVLITNITTGIVNGSGEGFVSHELLFIVITLNAIVYGGIYLFWLYDVHISLRERDESYPITPGGSVLRVLIPIYNIYGIWKVYSTMSHHFKNHLAEKNLGTKLANRIPILYVLYLVSSTINFYLGTWPAEESVSLGWLLSYIVDAALIVTYILIVNLVSTGLIKLSKEDSSNEEQLKSRLQ